jgi:hypothetical protein
MKIGTSYSRCLLDIFEGRVNENEVMVIIARTDFDPREDSQWKSIWKGYRSGGGFSHPEWYALKDEDEAKIRKISVEMYEDGKIHQPRKFGGYPKRMQQYWYDLVLTDGVKDSNPAVKKAWDHYKMLANLT